MKIKKEHQQQEEKLSVFQKRQLALKLTKSSLCMVNTGNGFKKNRPKTDLKVCRQGITDTLEV